ncbi:MAG TPA: leucyl/phenylalanyl-tRNA--protein transferase [Sphingomicrobium sp.]|nr:leucyl/phenylalanyl-tRNA--protein transferase [Sphingomicrobium sp.]
MSRLDPRLLLQGYASGIFPMADSRNASELFWVEPRQRAIIPLDGFHLSRSLRRTLRSDRFKVTHDRDFAGVIAACADREETWINAELEQAMLALHGSGHAHSIEVWRDDELVGGLYGVRLGRAFFGESMFSRMTDASKVALAWLVARLKVGNFTLLDCQFMTEHLASLGAVTVPRETYVALLSAALGGGAGSVAGGVAAESPDVPAGSLPNFLALDRLLEVTGAAGAGGPAGYVISQLLGQTS